MVDFLLISTRPGKRGIVEIYPHFRTFPPSEQLMIRGGDFYAVWVEEKGLWSMNERDALHIIDQELAEYARKNADRFECGYKVMYMFDSDSGSIDKWHRYCQNQMRDSFVTLDEKIIFSNTVTSRKDYASKRLPYPLEKGSIDAWDRLVGTLYSEKERKKIEWAIGSIVTGDSVNLQKFLVFYGSAGTGKSTILNIIEKLFEGYTSVFDAKALGSSSNRFALEPLRKNPLVAIQHDGDLSHIEDNTRLNSLVSHELMPVDTKNKSIYENRFKCFLFMGTNRPVKITDAKSGLIRRLIDVSPTGDKLKPSEYKRVVSQIEFELGAIAYHCMEVYKEDPGAYDDYIPLEMLGATNDFYNFVMDSWNVFQRDDETTLKAAWTMYKVYCDDAKVSFPYSQRAFKEELKNYFREYSERDLLPDGTRVRSHYTGFKTEKFEEETVDTDDESINSWIQFKEQTSIFDTECSDCPAQYAKDNIPERSWDLCTTKLSDIDTSRLHYVRVPLNHIVIDFDIPDENGEKSLERNLEAAGKWPPTYAEVSKSGKGIHLHYIYNGDPTQLSAIYDGHIEVKVAIGKSSLRRMHTLCNDIPIATLTHGLPLKEAKKTLNYDGLQTEKGLRTSIQKALAKDLPNCPNSTKTNIDFIHHILEDAYNSGIVYNVSDMEGAITGFAANSTHQKQYCVKKVTTMKFRSKEDPEEAKPDTSDSPFVFYDVEVFPNLFLVNWKAMGEGKPVVRMINPKPAEIEELIKFKLIGFNCRRYDNHILYGRLLGYSNKQLYDLSQRIISGGKIADCFFSEAYNLSYTDIYDFASAGNKKSLKKLEIEMGIHHQELGLPWDKPVPEELWLKVAEYCDNDVIATEAAFNYLSADWTARQILADLAGMTVNDTTNSLTTRIIFDRVRRPQDQFCYRDLSQPVKQLKKEVLDFLKDADPEMMSQLHGEEESLLPYFPGYTYSKGISTFMDEEVGEGGYVYAEPGMYTNVGLLDIASMHPHSVIAECLFGPIFTKKFKEIVDGRVSIKHKAWDEVNRMLDGKLTPYVQKVQNGEMTAKQLANALKTAINSVYGLTSAAFENAFRDPRNKDNIVAKRGALFMVCLKHEVQKRGYTVAHIKTDSIKIPNADNDIIQFVMDFGKKHGYTFEHEATYSRMCLVNNAVYIAQYDTAEACNDRYGYIPGDNKDHPNEWTATGKQFAVPYVFKKLFSREKIEFDDLCKVFSVSGALYLDMNESLPNVEHEEEMLVKKLKELGFTYDNWLDYKDGSDQITFSVNDERYLRELDDLIAKGHDYHFIGKVGQFTPIKSGWGGGVLLRESGGKYASATESKGYRWLESETVRALELHNGVDYSYYDQLVNDAKDTIAQYGDFEWFVSDDTEYPPEG